jgi:DNA-binding beta-propeller fold protein YncE
LGVKRTSADGITAIPEALIFALLIDDQSQSTPSERQDITVGNQPFALAFDGTSIWSVNLGGGLSKVSASDGSYLGTFGIASLNAVFSLGTTIWVAGSYETGGGGFLATLSPDGHQLQNFNVPQQQPVAWIAIQADLPEPLFYFVDINSGLFRFSPMTGQLTALGQTGGLGPLLFDGTNIWISSADTNSVIKLDMFGAVQGTFPVGKFPGGLAFDGNSIWVANYNDGTVTQLSVNGQALQTIATGNNPNSIAFDGVNLWVTNWGSNTLTQIRASDGAVLGNLPTGLNPAGVLFDGSHIWVANSGSNTISRF